MERNQIVKFCEEYLKVKDFDDFCHNGLQVEGAAEVKKIITGVTLSQKLIEAAIEKKAQMIIVHHGLFVKYLGDKPEIKGVWRNRLKMLLTNDINLCGFHLPLDAHPDIGNNISICRLLGITKNVQPIDVGFIGELPKAMAFAGFVSLVKEKINPQVNALNCGQDLVKKIGVISGGASGDIHLIAEAGADTFLAGDIRESVVRPIEELKMNFINAGHYNTETFGIKNLGDLVAKKFGVDVEFVDIPCEI